jgi:hypothetical protein
MSPPTQPTTLNLQAKQPTPTDLHMSNKKSSLMSKIYALHYAQLFSHSRNEDSENEAHYWLLHYIYIYIYIYIHIHIQGVPGGM